MLPRRSHLLLIAVVFSSAATGCSSAARQVDGGADCGTTDGGDGGDGTACQPAARCAQVQVYRVAVAWSVHTHRSEMLDPRVSEESALKHPARGELTMFVSVASTTSPIAHVQSALVEPRVANFGPLMPARG